ncbi:hypothetical protein V8G54_004695 [Vigna mungo]|uniref:Transposase MuDR plant domain-containing protein n=1 Tax=Vigna mungo TaxID=3915 RepID=A0AAQ3PDX3_VIGMU
MKSEIRAFEITLEIEDRVKCTFGDLEVLLALFVVYLEVRSEFYSKVHSKMANCDFEVVFHHGGKFVNDGSLKYEFGETSTLKIDPDRWIYFEILSILKEMGYINVKELWYSVGGGSVLKGRLELLFDDNGASHLVNLAILNGQSHLYVMHMVSDPEYVPILGDGVEAGNNKRVDVEDGNDNCVEAEVEGEDIRAVLGDNVEDGNDNCVEAETEGESDGAVLGKDTDGDNDNGVEAEAEGEDDRGHDDYDDVFSEDNLVEVSVHGVEGENDFCKRSEEVEVGGPSGSSNPFQHESESLDCLVLSDSSNDHRDHYGNFGTFSMPKSMEEYKWEVGTFLNEKKDFTKAIRSYGVENGRKLKVFKNDKRRVCVKCCGAKGKCPWYAYCAYKAAQNTWQLRKIINNHTCSKEFNIRLVTSKWLNGRLEKTIKENSSINLTNLQNKVSKKWNISVSRSTTFRAKTMAYKKIEGDFKEQYKRLHDYANELLRSNPRSTVKVSVNLDANEENRIFKRLYVCLKACKVSFISCRPIIGLDGCFLKGKYGGELLSAIGRDGNDYMLPLAYAVVEVENKETWTWFLELLIDDLSGAANCSTYTFISYQQKYDTLLFDVLVFEINFYTCIDYFG